MSSPKFPLGIIINTPGAIEKVNREDALACLLKHEAADWEDAPAEDRKENETALACGLRIWTTHRDRNNTLFWIITESDRSSTTILLPSEY